MKLTILGGAGVRTPLIVSGLIRWNDKVPISKLVLYDIDSKKLRLIGALVKFIVQKSGNLFEVELSEDLTEAVKGANFIYTAIRVGGDEGRIKDEKIALKYGILGQETTGPGGFSMALRTIPVMLEFAKVIEKEAPDAWVINFTNPSGLIAEALYKHTKIKAIGICDAPSQLKVEIAKFFKEDEHAIYMNYIGLNHLGWVNSIRIRGKEVLHEVLNNYSKFIEGFPHMSCFSEDFIHRLKLLPNEYLYFYYYSDQAVHNISKSSFTRGEQIKQLNERLIQDLQMYVEANDWDKALNQYERIMNERNQSYMSNETGNRHSTQSLTLQSEGYEGLAMSILSSIIHNKKTDLILNVPNNGAISDLQDDDIVEVTCMLDHNGPRPYAVGKLPHGVKGLVEIVKEYERLTVSAAVHGNYDDAVMALTIHPLVRSRPLAEKIVSSYLIAHSNHLPQFSQGRTLNV
jgi:6-phospho-beta-glucosidase